MTSIFIFSEIKADKEKKEENQKKRELGLKKNAEFLKSLDLFKEKVTLHYTMQLTFIKSHDKEFFFLFLSGISVHNSQCTLII